MKNNPFKNSQKKKVGPILLGICGLLGISMFIVDQDLALLAPAFYVLTVISALYSSRSITLMIVLMTITFNGIVILTTGGDIHLLVVGGIGLCLIGFFITRQVEAMRKVQRYQNERNVMLEVSSTLTKNLDMERLTKQVLDHVFRLFAADGCTLYLIEDNKEYLTPVGAAEKDHDEEVIARILKQRPKVGVGLAGWVAEKGESILSGDAEMDVRSIHIPGTPYDLESVMLVPLTSEQDTIGVLFIYKLCLNAFDEEDLELAKIIGNQASIAIANARLYEHVRNLSEIDNLTGVWNSRNLSNLVDNFILESGQKGTSLSILFIDCDNFKEINDHFGHPVGDQFLRFFAGVLREGIRDQDAIVRYAGDEFVILLPDTPTKAAIKVVERLNQLIEKRRMPDYPDLWTTVSMGLASYPAHASSGEELIKYADDALYKAKRRGKNQFAIYREEGD